MSYAQSSGEAGLPRPEDTHHHRGRFIVPTLIAAMCVWLFSYAYTGAPVVPVWDGWTWIAQAKSYAEGGFGSLLREQMFIHDQHLYVLPSLIALILGPLVDYSFRLFAFLCVAVVIACGLTFYRLARANGLGRFESLAVFLAVASFRQFENLLCGFQLGLVLSVLLGTLAVIVADVRRDRRGLVAAIVLALAAVASSSAGVLACIAIILVRWFDPGRPRNWIVVGLAVGTILPAIHFTLTRLALLQRSFVAEAVGDLKRSPLPRLFVDGVKIVGGGLVGGKAATPVGLALLAGTCAMIVVQVRRTRRFDALSGLALSSLLTTLTIGVVRSPFEFPTSRHAIFAAPLVGVCAIGLLRLLSSRAVLWPASSAVFVVGLAWLNADARLEAEEYQGLIAAWELDTRFCLAALLGDGKLTKEEIGRVNPGPTEFIRGLMDFTRERRLLIFSPDYHGVEVHDELPTLTHGAAQGRVENGTLQFAGQGYMYNEYVCRFASGCTARLSVDIAVKGKVAMGFIVRRANGEEKSNVSVPVPERDRFSVHSMRIEAAEGETLDPYVFAWSPDDVVKIKSASVVLLQSSQIP